MLDILGELAYRYVVALVRGGPGSKLSGVALKDVGFFTRGKVLLLELLTSPLLASCLSTAQMMRNWRKFASGCPNLEFPNFAEFSGVVHNIVANLGNSGFHAFP